MKWNAIAFECTHNNEAFSRQKLGFAFVNSVSMYFNYVLANNIGQNTSEQVKI